MFPALPAWGTATEQRAKLTASDGAEGDTFGISVAIDEDTAVVGAYLDGRATLRGILPLTRELHHRLS